MPLAAGLQDVDSQVGRGRDAAGVAGGDEGDVPGQRRHGMGGVGGALPDVALWVGVDVGGDLQSVAAAQGGQCRVAVRGEGDAPGQAARVQVVVVGDRDDPRTTAAVPGVPGAGEEERSGLALSPPAPGEFAGQLGEQALVHGEAVPGGVHWPAPGGGRTVPRRPRWTSLR